MELMIRESPDYTSISNKGTGSQIIDDLQTREVTLGKYTISVRVTKENKFVGVSEVRINTPELWNRISPIGFADVDDEYPE